MKNKPKNIYSAIHDLVEGALSEKEAEKLWAHLLSNSDDFEYYQTLATLKKMGKEGSIPGISSTREKIPAIYTINRIKPYLVAAALLIMSMGVLYNIFSEVESVSGFTPVAMIEYDIERSADEITSFDTILQQAISSATAGDLESALRALDKVEETLAPDDLDLYTEITLVRGSVLYNSGVYDEAINTFNELIQLNPNKVNREKAIWYLANAQMQAGYVDEAKENIEKVIEMDGAFSRVAERALMSI